jgi:hypothetical protein
MVRERNAVRQRAMQDDAARPGIAPHLPVWDPSDARYGQQLGA